MNGYSERTLYTIERSCFAVHLLESLNVIFAL